MRRALFIIAVMSLGLCGACYRESQATREKRAAMRDGLVEFHEKMNQQRFADIYAEAEATLRNAISESDFIARLADARAKTGAYSTEAPNPKSISLMGGFWEDTRWSLTKRAIVANNHVTQCEAGIALEKFVWVIEKDRAKLAGYELEAAGHLQIGLGY